MIKAFLEWWNKPYQMTLHFSDCHCKEPVRSLCSEERKWYCVICLEWL